MHFPLCVQSGLYCDCPHAINTPLCQPHPEHGEAVGQDSLSAVEEGHSVANCSPPLPLAAVRSQPERSRERPLTSSRHSTGGAATAKQQVSISQGALCISCWSAVGPYSVWNTCSDHKGQASHIWILHRESQGQRAFLMAITTETKGECSRRRQKRKGQSKRRLWAWGEEEKEPRPLWTLGSLSSPSVVASWA